MTAVVETHGLTESCGLGLTLAAHLWNGLAPLSGSLESYQKLSPFYPYSSTQVYQRGLAWGNGGILLGLAALFLLASLPLFQRKDLGV